MYKIVICGLGAVGMTYACKFKHKNVCLKILADHSRIESFKVNKPCLNGTPQEFDYITQEDCFIADLIIISTKAQGLESAISYIKNCIGENSRIISLINGISSEEKIKKAYPSAKVLKSYFIGHSAVREGNNTTQDGIGTIVLEKDEITEKILKDLNIDYFVPDDIDYSMWLKYTFNLFSNQVSAILDMTFGEMRQNKYFIDFAKNVIKEVKQIADKKGIKNLDNLEKDAINSLSKMCDEGKTSMLQDILAKRPTEVDMFAGEIIRMGKLYGIQTPYNQILYDLIKIKESNNEHSIHSC